MNRIAVDIVIVVAALVLYYKVVLVVVRDKLVSAGVQLLLSHFRTLRSPVGDIENVTTLVFGAVSQVLLFSLLVACSSINARQLWRGAPHQSQLLVYGAVLGFGEMLLGSFLGLVVIKLSAAIPNLGNPLLHWQVVLNSGWMRLFNTTLNLLPLPAAISLVLLYVGVEELIIRGIVFNVLLPVGHFSAVFFSTVIFAGYQVFNLPSWRVAMFPVIGALVMGIIHGVLYLAVPDVWPLVVAHVTYFTIVALTFR
jgi:hypothetical protein